MLFLKIVWEHIFMALDWEEFLKTLIRLQSIKKNIDKSNLIKFSHFHSSQVTVSNKVSTIK